LNARTKIALGLLAIAAYSVAAWWLSATYTGVRGRENLLLVAPYRKLDGSAYITIRGTAKFEALVDDEAHPNRSPMIVYEDDKPLGPAHSLHRDIAKLGLGRFSHWEKSGFIFSTSDNSDPNSNGRVYRALIPEE
jgi:hypothetical protein